MLNIILLRNTCIRIHLYVKEADQKHQKVEKSWNKMVSRKKTWDKIRHIMGNTIGMLKTYWIEMKTQTAFVPCNNSTTSRYPASKIKRVCKTIPILRRKT